MYQGAVAGDEAVEVFLEVGSGFCADCEAAVRGCVKVGGCVGGREDGEGRGDVGEGAREESQCVGERGHEDVGVCDGSATEREEE